MSPNPPIEDLKTRLSEFVAYRKNHLTGDEKGEAQLFLERFFRAFGHEGVREAGATLEKRVQKRDNGGTAYADLVWKPRVLVEMKKAGRDLGRDYRQAFEYWEQLVPDRPRYTILCNFDEFWVYDLNSQLEEPVDRVPLDQLPQRWDAMAFMLPREEKPSFANDQVQVTRDTAARVSVVFNGLVDRGVDRDTAQKFILQAVMAMFSEDIGLLPRPAFRRALEEVTDGAGSAYDLVFGLFREMNTKGTTPGGRYEGTPYFNGGLYADVRPFELHDSEVEALLAAARDDWSQVRPVIFGTLFEQSLDKPERHAYGAYFTSEADIYKVVMPSIVRPWRKRIEAAGTLKELGDLEQQLVNFQVLDPACGSGNFLFVAYREMRRLERQIAEKRQLLGRAPGRFDATSIAFVTTTQFHGIDLRPFAVEVAKVTLMLARKLAADELGDERTYLPLDDLDNNFQTANAVLADWPRFDVCIGNPPYLGQTNWGAEKDPAEIAALRRAYPDIAGRSDYVSYWFRKTHDLMPAGSHAGLVGTANIRSGDTRKSTLDHIVDNDGTIIDAVSSQPWSGDASVEVSIVNWVKGAWPDPKMLWLSRGTTKLETDLITGNLSSETDLRAAKKLSVNRKPQRIFQGQTPQTKHFVLTEAQAQAMVARDPKSAAVLHPYLIGKELSKTARPTRYIIDIDAPDAMAAEAQAPAAYAHVRKHVLPLREGKVEKEAKRNALTAAADPSARLNWERRDFMRTWWQLWRRRPDLWKGIAGLDRYIVLSRVAVFSRPSIYAFVSSEIHPGDALNVFAFDDDYSFGILHSTAHRRYFEERCSKMRVDPRYTSRTVFDTFPWPQAPTEEMVESIVDVVVRLMAFREERAADGISLERQYASLRDPGRNPLRALQEELDAAVMVAYGFDAEDDVLTQMLALNQSIAEEEDAGLTAPRAPGNAGLANTKRSTQRIESSMTLTGQ